MKFRAAFEIIKERVMPNVLVKAEREKVETGNGSGPRQTHAKTWWQFWRPRPQVIARLRTIPRYVAGSSVTKRPIFQFIDSHIHPNAQVIAFKFADDYSFGILQSGMHWEWFKARCSTFKSDFRYTSDTVFDTFPWPQKPNAKQIRAVADAGCELRALRQEIMQGNGWSLRELYRALETPGDNKPRTIHTSLDPKNGS